MQNLHDTVDLVNQVAKDLLFDPNQDNISEVIRALREDTEIPALKVSFRIHIGRKHGLFIHLMYVCPHKIFEYANEGQQFSLGTLKDEDYSRYHCISGHSSCWKDGTARRVIAIAREYFPKGNLSRCDNIFVEFALTTTKIKLGVVPHGPDQEGRIYNHYTLYK